jgi:hypothetical protein
LVHPAKIWAMMNPFEYVMSSNEIDSIILHVKLHQTSPTNCESTCTIAFEKQSIDREKCNAMS